MSSDEVSGVTEEWDRLDFDKARNIDEQLDDEQAVQLAMKKLIQHVGTSPEEDVGPMEAAYRTIATIDQMAQQLNRLQNTVDKIDRTADTALTIAETGAKPGDAVSKKNVAKLKARNELIKRAALDESSSRGVNVTCTEVQAMCKPDLDVFHQTVYDAWSDLESKWTAFTTGQNEDGDKVLQLVPDELDPALVKTVESELGRDDLTKRLLSDAQRVGV